MTDYEAEWAYVAKQYVQMAKMCPQYSDEMQHKAARAVANSLMNGAISRGREM